MRACVCVRAWVRACAYAYKGGRVEVLLQFSCERDILLDNTTNQCHNLIPRSAMCSSACIQCGIGNLC